MLNEIEIEHDDEAIVARLRDFIDEIRELDLENKALDRRRRDLYKIAAEYGFNAGILKKIARQRHDGEAENEANEQLAYVAAIGGEKATDQMRKGKSFSEVAFGSCGWPSEFADAINVDDSELIRGWGHQDEHRNVTEP
jgi:uncharacterized protein (UPF0335 family)